jgi:hypothetical protein
MIKNTSWGLIFGTLFAITLFCLAACGSDDPNRPSVSNPKTGVIGTFDGCEVSYVNRGYRDNSFYLAKCPAASGTLSGLYRSGKSTYPTQTITIQDAEATLKAQAEEKRNNALAKLTPEERQLLGVK